jgi:hypothetical protein
MADLEDALKKLDRFTQEEARMAHTEVLRITHSIRNEVKMVDGKVEGVGDKVEEIGSKVGDKVQCVDEKVQVVIDGARGLSSHFENHSNIHTFRRKTSKSCCEGSKADCSTDGQRRRRNKVFVSLFYSCCRLLLALKLTHREPVETTPENLAHSC